MVNRAVDRGREIKRQNERSLMGFLNHIKINVQFLSNFYNKKIKINTLILRIIGR